MTSKSKDKRIAKFIPKDIIDDKKYLQKLNHLLNLFIIENLHEFTRNEKDLLIEAGNLIERYKGLK